MAEFKSFREHSKTNYGQNRNEKATVDEINTGSLQRIADATEKMASNYTQMQKELENYKILYEENRKEIAGLHRTIITLKGRLTRAKKKLEASVKIRSSDFLGGIDKAFLLNKSDLENPASKFKMHNPPEPPKNRKRKRKSE